MHKPIAGFEVNLTGLLSLLLKLVDLELIIVHKFGHLPGVPRPQEEQENAYVDHQ